MNNTKNYTLLSVTLLLIIVDAFWGFLYTKTVFASNIYSYASFILLFVLSLAVAIKYKISTSSPICLVWLPYLLYTILGYFIETNMHPMTSWINCLILLMVSRGANFQDAVPYKVFYWSGLIALLGVFIQLLFPVYYLGSIVGIFQDVDRLSMFEERGLSGFTYNTGATAIILLYAEVVVLYLRDRIPNLLLKRNIFYYAVLIIIIIGILLTSKRSLSILAITLPVIVNWFSNKFSGKKVLAFVGIALFVILFYYFFVSHLTDMSDMRISRRFVDTYLGLQEGEDITTGRSELSMMAINAFREHPIFGVGIGKYMEYTNAYTDVHNTYLQVLCEQGIVGFVLYLIPLIYCFMYSIKLMRRHKVSNMRSLLVFSFVFQLVYILYGFTGNVNIGSGYTMYFIAISVMISISSSL